MKKVEDEFPPYTVRVSLRAKRMGINVSPLGEVEVVLPKRFSQRKAHAFVKENAVWVRRTVAKIKGKATQQPVLAASVHLCATGESLNVCYESAEKTQITDVGGVLRVHSPDENQAREALRYWQQNKAKKILIPWLERVSEEIQLPFKRVTVRCQKTRWGSCSRQNNINLNRNLIFFSPEVVRYLLIHELCHTVHFNHSAEFWALVKTFEPDMKALDKQLNQASMNVPLWASP